MRCSTDPGTLEHRRDTGAGGVMGVHVDWNIGELVSQRSNEYLRSFWLQYSGHILKLKKFESKNLCEYGYYTTVEVCSL